MLGLGNEHSRSGGTHQVHKVPADAHGRWAVVNQSSLPLRHRVFFTAGRSRVGGELRRMMAWPVAVGMLAHALRCAALAVLGFSAAISALIACLVVGLILTPVACRRQMPFAAIGFASVVSMMPGVFLFRMASGLLQIANDPHSPLDLLSATIADGLIAGTIIIAMSFGLIVPKLAIDRICERRGR